MKSNPVRHPEGLLPSELYTRCDSGGSLIAFPPEGRGMAAGPGFDREKFEELILYIARRLPPEAALGRVKLVKLLMLCDFTAYRRMGQPITGAHYQKWEHGHLPEEFVRSEKDMQAGPDPVLKERQVDYFGKTLRQMTAERDPSMERFSEDELAIIEGVLQRYGHESASYLSQLSHQELGWQLAKDREEIPYSTALIPAMPPPDSVVEEFRQLYGPRTA